MNNYQIVARKYGSVITINGLVNTKVRGTGQKLFSIQDNYPSLNISFPANAYKSESGTARINTSGFIIFDIPLENKDYYFNLSYCR